VYEKHFGLKARPFSIAPDPKYLYLGANHQEAMAHLLYGAQNGGFVLLSGEVGTGKTTLCRYLLGHMPKGVDVALVLHPMLSTNELLATICDELKISYKQPCTDKLLIDHINKHLLKAYATGRSVLLIVDEAQNLSLEVLEQLRLLTNLETDDKKLLQIILVGQPELLDKLARRQMRQLVQRITARYHLRALSRGEMKQYIKHRLATCGVKAPLFSWPALWWLHSRTGGIPRLVNMTCDRAMLGAYSANEYRVRARHVQRAAREVIVAPKLHWNDLPNWTGAVLRTVSLAVIIVGAFYWLGTNVSLNMNFGGPSQALVQPKPAVSPEAPTSVGFSDTQPSEQEEPSSSVAIATGTDPGNSRENAIAILFNRWNLNYISSRDGDFCLHALRKRLQCLKGRASIATLLDYNRPSLLHGVQGDDGRYHDVVLIGTEENMLRLTVGASVQDVSKDVFDNYWTGRYTILWRPPDAYSLPMREGDSGPMVSWLANRRAQLEGGAVLASWTLEGELLEWLIRFQRENRLPATGIIGPETVIMIANLSKSDVPRLKSI
jgi:general secretion pathway protein A